MFQYPSGSVTLVCEVNEKVEPVHSISELSNESNDIGSTGLQSDLETLLELGEFSDVTLIAGDSRFKAHKGILCTRSPVFKKMFTIKMREESSNTVSISEMDSDALQEMLTFLYTGTAPNINNRTWPTSSCMLQKNTSYLD